MFRLESLRYICGERTIFNDLNLQIRRGKITALFGRSGVGKTTLLKLLVGIERPDVGEVWVNDRRLSLMSRQELYNLRKGMGFLLQSGALFPEMNVLENVAFPLRIHTHLPDSLIQSICQLKLKSVGLPGSLSLMPSELSGGMSRRVALAKALALDPKMLILDEPFAGQDPENVLRISNLVEELKRSFGTTTLIVSHDFPETMALADFVYILSDCRVVAQGEKADFAGLPEAKLRELLSQTTPSWGEVFEQSRTSLEGAPVHRR